MDGTFSEGYRYPMTPDFLDKRHRRRSGSAHRRNVSRYMVDSRCLQELSNNSKSLRNCDAIGIRTPAEVQADSWAVPVGNSASIPQQKYAAFGQETCHRKHTPTFGVETKGVEPDSSSLMKRRSASIPSLLSSSDCPIADAYLDEEDVFESPRGLPLGLHNLGYTCYQNAVIQCLYATKCLRDRLELLSYGPEPEGGSRDDLAWRLGNLMASISNERYSSLYSDLFNFRAAVGAKLHQFGRVEQHDAQEFLLTLLDSLHSDLASPNSKSNPSSGQSHLASLKGESPVSSLFQGQICSSVVCSGCGYCSVTFDPFTGLSLPIQKFDILPIQVSIVHRAKMAGKKNITHTFFLNDKMTAKDLKRIISLETGIEESSLLLCDMAKKTFGQLLKDTATAKELLDCKSLHTFEAPCYKGSEAVAPILVLLANRADRRFGQPLVLRVRRNLTLHQFQSVVLNAMKEQLQLQTQGMNEVISNKVLFDSQVVTNNNKEGLGVLRDQGKGLFHHCTVEAGLLEAEVHGQTPHVRILANWSPATRDRLFKESVDSYEVPAVAVSMTSKARREKLACTITLDECIRGYFQKEHVSGVEWRCPKCNSLQSEITKKFDFCVLPQVMIVSVKRFQQRYSSRSQTVVGTKLNTLVQFPTSDLDMSSHMWQGEAIVSDVAEDPGDLNSRGREREEKEKEKKTKFNGKRLFSKLKTKKSTPSTAGDTVVVNSSLPTSERKVSSASNGSSEENKKGFLYDLYAVIDHKGTMESGHYTAMCKSTASNSWYLCDDSRVREVPQNKVMSENAYILFYARKDTLFDTVFDPDDCLSSVSSLTDSATQFHFTVDAYSSSDADSRMSVSSGHSKSQHESQSRSHSVQSSHLMPLWSTNSPEPWSPRLPSPKQPTQSRKVPHAQCTQTSQSQPVNNAHLDSIHPDDTGVRLNGSGSGSRTADDIQPHTAAIASGGCSSATGNKPQGIVVPLSSPERSPREPKLCTTSSARQHNSFPSPSKQGHLSGARQPIDSRNTASHSSESVSCEDHMHNGCVPKTVRPSCATHYGQWEGPSAKQAQRKPVVPNGPRMSFLTSSRNLSAPMDLQGAADAPSSKCMLPEGQLLLSGTLV